MLPPPPPPSLAPLAPPLKPSASPLGRFAFAATRRNLALSAGALAAHAGAVALHTAASMYTYRRGVAAYSGGGGAPLRDVLHDVLPNVQAWRSLPEVLHLLPVLALGAAVLRTADQRALDALRVFLWCHAALLTTRALSFSSTLLPDASQQCRAAAVTGWLGGCHDLIFSGHVTIMSLAALVLQHFFTVRATSRALLWGAHAAVCGLVIACRNHYSVDVLLAVVLSAAVFGAFTRHPRLLALSAAAPHHALLRDVTRWGSAAVARAARAGGGGAGFAPCTGSGCDCSGYAQREARTPQPRMPRSPPPLLCGGGEGAVGALAPLPRGAAAFLARGSGGSGSGSGGATLRRRGRSCPPLPRSGTTAALSRRSLHTRVASPPPPPPPPLPLHAPISGSWARPSSGNSAYTVSGGGAAAGE